MGTADARSAGDVRRGGGSACGGAVKDALDTLQDVIIRACDQETDILYSIAVGDLPASAIDTFNASYIGQVLILFRQMAERAQAGVDAWAAMAEKN